MKTIALNESSRLGLGRQAETPVPADDHASVLDIRSNASAGSDGLVRALPLSGEPDFDDLDRVRTDLAELPRPVLVRASDPSLGVAVIAAADAVDLDIPVSATLRRARDHEIEVSATHADLAERYAAMRKTPSSPTSPGA